MQHKSSVERWVWTWALSGMQIWPYSNMPRRLCDSNIEGEDVRQGKINWQRHKRRTRSIMTRSTLILGYAMVSSGMFWIEHGNIREYSIISIREFSAGTVVLLKNSRRETKKGDKWYYDGLHGPWPQACGSVQTVLLCNYFGLALLSVSFYFVLAIFLAKTSVLH